MEVIQFRKRVASAAPHMDIAGMTDSVPTDALEKVRERIRSRLQETGKSAYNLSKEAGFGISYVSDLLTGRSKKTSISRLETLAQHLECDVEYLLGAQDTPRGAGPSPRHTTAATIPHYPVTLTDPDGYFPMEDGLAVGWTPSIAGDASGAVYAVTIGDDSMSPRYMAGEIVCANARRAITSGAFVVVRTNEDRGIVRQVSSITGTTVELVALNGGEKIALPRDAIKTIHRITACLEG